MFGWRTRGCTRRMNSERVHGDRSGHDCHVGGRGGDVAVVMRSVACKPPSVKSVDSRFPPKPRAPALSHAVGGVRRFANTRKILDRNTRDAAQRARSSAARSLYGSRSMFPTARL